NKNIKINYKYFTKTLLDRGIDTRPIISGNMALQPAIRHFDIDLSMGPFLGAQEIHDRGFFVGCHSKLLSPERIYWLADTILNTIEEQCR
ncbi:MAG: hypothetical protein Q8M56_02035, partial [Desulfobacterales bacterium]|nr:hypothetical protein [Desulfobacterales bacterium]